MRKRKGSWLDPVLILGHTPAQIAGVVLVPDQGREESVKVNSTHGVALSSEKLSFASSTSTAVGLGCACMHGEPRRQTQRNLRDTCVHMYKTRTRGNSRDL